MILEEPVRGVFSYLEHPGLLSLSGLEQMRAFQRREIPYGPISFLMGLDLVAAGEGECTWRLPVTSWLQSEAGVLTGGVNALVADGALGSAIMTTQPPHTTLATSELSLNFLRPATLASDALVAWASLIQAGRSQGLAEARVEDARGNLLAHATSRCVIVRLPDPAPEPPDLPIPWPTYEGPHPFERPAEGEVIPQEVWDRMSGPEMVAGFMDGSLPGCPIEALVGQRLVEAGEGSATLAMPASPWLCTAAGNLYGGALAMILDHAMNTAVHTTVGAGTSWGTLDLKVNFLRPPAPDGRDLLARAGVVHRGKTIAVTTGEIVDGSGRRIALGTCSSMIMPGKPWLPGHPAAPIDEAGPDD